MKHVVNFSGGLCSFWAAHRVIQKHGTENVTLLFADTLVEDKDLYKFNDDVEKHLGVPITRICQGMTPWGLFRKEKMIGSARVPLCSIKLKREPLQKWHAENCDPKDTIIYVGMDWTEEHRLARLRQKESTWTWEAPMIWEPIWDKFKMVSELAALNIPLPRAYTEGFPHNNCGRRCVAAGITHWAHLYSIDRSAYEEWMKEEELTMREFKQQGVKPLTMLKDRRGGATKPMTLRDLAKRIDAGEKVGREDWGGCGCSVQYDKPEVEDWV